MKLKDTGLTFQDIKDKVDKYMIETYERFDFLAETAKDQYMYDENGTPYLDFYAGIAVNSAGNCNEKVVAAVKDQVEDIMHTFNYPYTIPQALLAEKICTTIGMDTSISASIRHWLSTGSMMTISWRLASRLWARYRPTRPPPAIQTFIILPHYTNGIGYLARERNTACSVRTVGQMVSSS